MPNRLLPPGAFDNNLNIRVNRLASKLSVLLQRRVGRPLGISGPEARILINLARYGDTHLRQLSRHTSLDASHISKVMPRMEQKGLVSRTRDPEDKRLVLFSLTDKGRDIFASIWPHVTNIAEEVRSLFSEKEFMLIRDGIDRVSGRIDELLENTVAEDGQK